MWLNIYKKWPTLLLWQGFRFALHSQPIQKRNIAIYMIPTTHNIKIKMALKKDDFSIYSQSGIFAMSIHSIPQHPPDVIISRSHSSHRPSQLLNNDCRELLISLQVLFFLFFFPRGCHCFYLSSIRIPNVTWRTNMKWDIIKIQSFLMVQEALHVILSTRAAPCGWAIQNWLFPLNVSSSLTI